MIDHVTLSASAIAVLRFRIKGFKMPVSDLRREAFRELAAAGIMIPVSGPDDAPEFDYHFTEEGWERREEWLKAAEAHLHSLEPSLPERIDLSEAARERLRRHIEGDNKVTDDNRHIYRELAAAGIMFPVSGFASGPEANFRFTHQGWSRRHEWLARPVESL